MVTFEALSSYTGLTGARQTSQNGIVGRFKSAKSVTIVVIPLSQKSNYDFHNLEIVGIPMENSGADDGNRTRVISLED